MRRFRPMQRRAAGALAGAAVAVFALTAPAPAGASARLLHYGGRAVAVPAGWPVYRLARRPGMCVRLDRRAVYLGTPAADQRCPASAIGRRRAILVDPRAAVAPSAGTHVRPRAQASAGVPGPAPPNSGSGTGSSYFTGLGFDACATPSTRAMSAWAASPFRAIGVYVGGANRACSQPNLTPSWVSAEIAAGWHLIPTYVGLQSPTSSCGSCAKLSAKKASGQGAAAATDAATRAGAVGIGAGSPIYFDMEAYRRTSGATNATLAFLAAWTSRLHALGYRSGVYSSSASGIADLAGQLDLGYAEPDDIWTANWNGRANTSDPYVPNGAWAPHRRLHQFRGGHNDTYGGVRINIDSDYVDGAAVGVAVAAKPPPLTVSRVRAFAATVRVHIRCGRPAGALCPGQILIRARIRVTVRGKRRGGRARTRIANVLIAHRGFKLAGGRSHTFRVHLNSRGRPLLRKLRHFRALLLVAIPGARAGRTVQLRRG